MRSARVFRSCPRKNRRPVTTRRQRHNRSERISIAVSLGCREHLGEGESGTMVGVQRSSRDHSASRGSGPPVSFLRAVMLLTDQPSFAQTKHCRFADPFNTARLSCRGNAPTCSGLSAWQQGCSEPRSSTTPKSWATSTRTNPQLTSKMERYATLMYGSSCHCRTC